MLPQSPVAYSNESPCKRDPRQIQLMLNCSLLIKQGEMSETDSRTNVYIWSCKKLKPVKLNKACPLINLPFTNYPP